MEHRDRNVAVAEKLDSPEMAWLGRQPYASLWASMQTRAVAIADGHAGECIWCCEHDPVYTMGRRGLDNRKVAELPAPLIHTDRGGETTFHGPGQLMLYPVLNLRLRGLGARRYVEILEQSCISMLERLGVMSGRRYGFPGVWSDTGKLAALGIRIQNGISYHGMALNVGVDLQWFDCIDPCGLRLPVDRLDCHVISLPHETELASMWTMQLIGLLS